MFSCLLDNGCGDRLLGDSGTTASEQDEGCGEDRLRVTISTASLGQFNRLNLTSAQKS
jgi:hypothetical protein